MDQGEFLKQLIANVASGTLAARMREIMPDVDRRVREGIRHDEIIAALNANGFAVNRNTFRSYLYRYRKKAGHAVDRPQTSPRFGVSEPVGRPAPIVEALCESPVEDRHGLDAVLEASRRDELGEKYLARARPLFKLKREGKT